MTGPAMLAIRRRLALARLDFHDLIYGESRNPDVAVAKVRDFERGKKPIPPVVARLAVLVDLYCASTGRLPHWSDHDALV